MSPDIGEFFILTRICIYGSTDMNKLAQALIILEDTQTTGESSSSSGSTEKLTESLKGIVKSPVFYAVIGGLVLLIILVYLLRRFVKPSNNTVKVIVRHGQIYKLLDEKSDKYFMVPFTDSLGAVISLGEREFASDKLFINNGPDALYQINYALRYKVSNVETFFKYRDSFQNVIVNQINDELRDYADKGHVLEIIKDYREHSKELVKLLNGLVERYGVEVTAFKVNFIQPLGRK